MLQHIIYNHAPYFARKYGSMAIWSTQGMEKTHYMARSGYFKHTQHGGGKIKSNSILELHQWQYRKLLQRAQHKKTISQSTISKALMIVNKQKRQQAWHNSSASRNHAIWRESKIRVGMKWSSASSEEALQPPH